MYVQKAGSSLCKLYCLMFVQAKIVICVLVRWHQKFVVHDSRVLLYRMNDFHGIACLVFQWETSVWSIADGLLYEEERYSDHLKNISCRRQIYAAKSCLYFTEQTTHSNFIPHDEFLKIKNLLYHLQVRRFTRWKKLVKRRKQMRDTYKQAQTWMTLITQYIGLEPREGKEGGREEVWKACPTLKWSIQEPTHPHLSHWWIRITDHCISQKLLSSKSKICINIPVSRRPKLNQYSKVWMVAVLVMKGVCWILFKLILSCFRETRIPPSSHNWLQGWDLV